MSTAKTFSIDSSSSNVTSKFAASVGRNCRGGEVFELISDLGGGKTTFVQGLAEGLGSKDVVSSPTFMLERVYAGRLPLHHFDFYRLGEAGIVGEEFKEVLEDQANVVAIEWGDVVHNVLPADRITIRIAKTGEDSRTLEVSVTENHGYLFEERS